MLSNVPDNVWAFLLVVLGAGVAFGGAHMGSKDLLAFGATVAGYGAALFQRGIAPKGAA